MGFLSQGFIEIFEVYFVVVDHSLHKFPVINQFSHIEPQHTVLEIHYFIYMGETFCFRSVNVILSIEIIYNSLIFCALITILRNIITVQNLPLHLVSNFPTLVCTIKYTVFQLFPNDWHFRWYYHRIFS